MELARKLAEGVGSWLQYQYACHNSSLFSERYLTEPIGQILSAHSRTRVIAEHRHPVLAPLAAGRGSKPSVDFVVLDPHPKVKIAVESKWIGQTKPSVRSIMWDLIRLELIAHAEGAECFFVLGGTKRALDAYFKQKEFTGPKSPHHPVLHAHTNEKFQVNLSPSATYRIAMMKKLFEKYQSTAFPHRIIARRTDPFPPDCKATQYQIYVWHITSKAKRDFFYPKNSTHYAASV